MKRGGFFCILILLVFLVVIPIISAIDTEITIKTLPSHRVEIRVLSPGEVYNLLESFYENSGGSGEVSVIFSSSVGSFNLGVWVKQDKELIVYKKFEDGYSTGVPLVLEVYPDWYVSQQNTTTTNETETTVTEDEESETVESDENIEEQEKSRNIGFSFFKESKFLSRNIVIIVESFVLLIIAFFVFIFLKRIKELTGFQFIKRHEKHEKKGERQEKKRRREEKKGQREKGDLHDKNRERVIENAEKKIREAQEEIRKIRENSRNEQKIAETKKKLIDDKKKLIEDQRELMKLRKGERKEEDKHENKE